MDEIDAPPLAKRMGRPPKVSREQILDAAGRTLSDELQLTSLAQQLGISVKTLYYYFPTRKALVAALTERAVAQMGLPAIESATSWREVLSLSARWHYELGASQPGWFFETAAPRGIGIEVLRLVQERLVALGWNERDALLAHGVAANWAIAAGVAACKTRSLGGLGPDNIRRQLDDYADPATIDTFARLMSALDAESIFADGLEIVLAGIERRLDPPAPGDAAD